YFFFSSRRRHTRSKRDWSSDVCSSALLFALLAILGLIWTRPKKNTIENKRWFLWILGISTFLPFIANTCGWFITELGRFPWTVRSEERRVGKEGRARGWPYHEKEKSKT